MESFKAIIDSIAQFMQNDLDFLNLGVYTPALYIIAAGVIVVLLAFFITLGIKSGSKINKVRKALEDATAYVNATGAIDENNVDGINSKIQKMPGSIKKGWGSFLDQQTGYPSDYITEKDVVGDRKANPKYRAGKVFYKLVCIITILLLIALSAISCVDMLKEATAENVTLVVLSVAGTMVAPLLFYVIFLAVLNACYKSQFKKFTASFLAFQDALNNNVIIFREEQDEFISENIEEINASIEEILANKLDNTEIIEIVTTPKVEEANIIPEQAVEVPVEEAAPVKEEIVAEAPIEESAPAPEVVAAEAEALTPEEEEARRGEHLINLVYIANEASNDPKVDDEELSELATVIYDAKVSGAYPYPEEQEIFDDCLTLLAARYYK